MDVRILLLVTLLASPLAAAEPHQHVGDPLAFPQMAPAHEALDSWVQQDEWLVAPASREYAGTRLAAVLIADADVPLRVQGRGVDDDGEPGPWLELQQRWAGPEGHRILVADLSGRRSMAQLRLAVAGPAPGLHALGWRLLDPVWEPGARDEAVPPPPPPPVIVERSVSPPLLGIGVVPREDWGASATQCTTPENTWYRFAIHHTAGNITSSGTVQGAVQALQAYAMGAGGWCDIPYQFLVGYDGSLWEGRALDYYSGATGGGNNDGNIAISHLGCFDPVCSSPDPAELIMIAAGRLLTQTLAAEHGIVTDANNLRGHRDWPNNSTVCPGEDIDSQLDAYRSTAAHYQAALASTSWSGTVQVELGTTVSLDVDLLNEGLETWTGNTRLAMLPRDVPHPLAAGSWISGTRVSSSPSDTPPGSVATFPLDMHGAQLGTFTLSLALVEEWVTWFADEPIGGGPAEGALILDVEVVEPPGDDDDAVDDDDAMDDDDAVDDDDAMDDDDAVDDDDSTHDDDAGEAGPGPIPSTRHSLLPSGDGCDCGASGSQALLPLALPVLLLGRRRRL